MAQAGYTPIQLYYSSTTTNAPTAGNLASGELAINITDGKLFYKDNGGSVQVIAWKTTPTTAGGTGLTSWTAGDLPYYATGTTLSKLGIGTNGQILTSTGTAPQWSTLSGVAVTTFSAGTTGFTPSSATSGAVTLAGTLATTNGGTGLTSFTANGVVYASSSSALTTGSALSFNGSDLTVANGDLTIATNGKKLYVNYIANNSGADLNINGAVNSIFAIASAEQMRLTSTGLGIGTSSPAYKLDVDKGSAGLVARFKGGTRSAYIYSDNDAVYFTSDTSVATAFGVNETSDILTFFTNNTERARIDSSGNLGLGVTPSAWAAGAEALQMGLISSLFDSTNGYTELAWNAFESASGVYTRWYSPSSQPASMYRQTSGNHSWLTAGSGASGSTISWTTAMTLDASGNLGVGTTSPSTFGALCTRRGISVAGVTGSVSASFSDGANDTLYISQDSALSRLTFAALTFNTGTTERFRIGPAGQIGLSGANYGTSGQVLTSNGSGSAPTWQNAGGGGSPGGSSGQVQYNSSGSFAGSANFFWDNGNARLGIGTSSPTVALDVRFGGVAALFTATNSNTNQIGFSNAANAAAGFYMGSPSQGALQFSDHNGIERMRITSGGDVGIGNSSPQAKLHVGSSTEAPGYGVSSQMVYVNGTSQPEVLVRETNSDVVGSIYAYASYVAVRAATVHPLVFFTSNSERARFTSDGYFKASNAGTYVSSTGLYHEFRQTDASNQGVVLSCTNGSFTSIALQIRADRNTTNDTFYAIRYFNDGAGAYKFNVADSGNVTNTNGSYGTISDAKMKTDIVDAGSQWADIKAIRFRKFKMKDDPSGLVQLGVVAQELEQTSPGLVAEHKDVDGEGVDLGTTTKSVKTSILLMKAAVALQEAMARIEQLEAKVAALEAK